jgi:hypothetical protein
MTLTPQARPHAETHFTGSEFVRDIVIGMSDGLTVPFALAAGLSGAVESSGIILTAGLAEVAAGASAMAYIQGLFTTGKPVRSAAQTVIVGGLAASAALLIAKALG